MINEVMTKVPLFGKNKITKEKQLLGFADVSPEDYPYLAQYRWHLNGGGYASTSIHGKLFTMHRMVMERVLGRKLSKGESELVVDHINGQRTCNTRQNLRLVTQAENCQNIKRNRPDAKIVSYTFGMISRDFDIVRSLAHYKYHFDFNRAISHILNEWYNTVGKYQIITSYDDED